MEIFAHRGIHDSNIRENSRAALEGIYSSNADGIEMDLRLTKDGICVLSHGTKSSAKVRISRHNYEQLLEKDTEIVRIDEAMDILREYNGLINLEVKHIFGERDRKLGQQCMEVLARDKKTLFDSLNARLLISSFSKSNISTGEKLLREIPRALLIARPMRASTLIETALAQGYEAVHISMARTKSAGFKEFVERAHEVKLKVRVYTVNEVDDFFRLKDARVDGVFSDSVERLIEWNR